MAQYRLFWMYSIALDFYLYVTTLSRNGEGFLVV